uniref:Monodehydroascorbate reductase n=1 Tax=Tanacetum cinerariifolium TaxID=118510 RepID=A0A6L2L3T1_TANCI|nr:monodehydroascorbate reductase [Tanacetum cinerariifolium]
MGVPIGKSNCYLDLDKSQSSPIYKIAMDLLKHTNFFRAFTTSLTIPLIYIQQFWDTVQYDKTVGCYRRQLDEQWFVLTKDTLREALQITPVNNNQSFISPLSVDALINFVNDLGNPMLVRNLSNVFNNDMFQPWRALTTIINLCLTGKTSGFERPRAPVLQILWGVITRAHIDYAKRIWEEFTQSIHTFIEDKRNLTRHTSRKKKATLIVILGIQFTKLIIHHLQRRHKFHPRHDSPLHLPNEELVLGYLKFSAKGTKREVFRMHIPGSLIIADIQEASYYQEYLANVAKHRRYLASETGSDSDSPAPKPTKPARKPMSTTPKAPPRPSVAAEDADLQKALEESIKSMYDVPRGPLPPVVIREPESWKYQPLPEVPGKGKAKSDSGEESEKVVIGADEGGQGEGQAGPDPGAQDEGQTGPDAGTQDEGQAGSNPDEQSEGQAGPDPSNAGADELSMPSPMVHAGSDREHMDLDVADVSSQPLKEQMDEWFTAMAYPKVQENLKLTVKEQVLLEEPASSSGTLSSLQHLSKDISFGDLFFSNKPSEADNNKANAETKVESMVSITIQQDMSLIPPMVSLIINLTLRPESPKVHQQFKATATETTTTTTTTLPPPPDQQQSAAKAIIKKRIGELEHIMSNLIEKNKGLEERLDRHGARLYTLKQLDIPHQVSKAVNEVVTDAETESYKSQEDHIQLYEALEKSMNRDHSKELAQDLAEARKKNKKSHESPKMPPGSPPHQPPPPLLLAGPSGALGAPGAFGSSQVPPPPPPPSSTNQESQSKTATSTEYQAWTTTDIRLRLSISLTPVDLQMDEDMAPNEQAQLSDDEDIGSAHIPKVNLRQDWWKPLEEERPTTPEPGWSISSSDVPVLTNNCASALASNYSPPPEDSLLVQTGDIATFMDWFCKRQGITELKPQDLEGLAFKIIKVFHPDVIHLQYQMEECHKLLTDSVDDPILRHNVSKPLPLGGPLGQVTIQSDFFFNKDLEYLRYGSNDSRHALSISKMKAAYYPDAGLEQMVPDEFWIEEECKYDIAAIAARTHMRILSVVRIEVFSMYGYDYMKKIVLRRANLNEHVIAERDFKYLYPSDFEDLYLLNLLDFQLGIESYQTQLYLTKPQWDATGFEYKHDYTAIDSPRSGMFQDRYGVQMMMRFNEIHNDRGTIEVGVDMAAGIGILNAMLMSDAVERLEKVKEGLRDIYDHVIEIPIQRIEDIKTGQRDLKARSLITGGERASLLEEVASWRGAMRDFEAP